MRDDEEPKLIPGIQTEACHVLSRDAPHVISASMKSASNNAVPIDWEALEDAFENNAPEVHSYLHLVTGEVLRLVDGVADPQMHVRVAADASYRRIEPVSSREQYGWMERFIQMVSEPELRGKLTHAITGKGAFRRFKDVLMTYAADRERWFTFRSEGLRTFMVAWLDAHAIEPGARPIWAGGDPGSEVADQSPPESSASSLLGEAEGPKSGSGRRTRNAEVLRASLREIGDSLGPRDLDLIVAFGELLKARRIARGFAHHEQQLQERRAAPDFTDAASPLRSR